MGWWDDLTWKISMTLDPIVNNAFNSASSAVDSVDRVVSRGIDTVGGAADRLVDAVKDNPVETAAIVAATVVTGGVAAAGAGAIASAAGAAGLLGSASTGTAIVTLSGAALESASLAAIGGGAIAASGGGMVAGAQVITGAGAALGAAVSSAGVAATKS
jgi:hypothetical protein